MKRRIAYKVASAVADRTRRYRMATVTRARYIVRRDYRRGRFDGLMMSVRLGVVDFGDWWRVNIAEPMHRFMEAAIEWAKQLQIVVQKMARAISAFRNMKFPPVVLT